MGENVACVGENEGVVGENAGAVGENGGALGKTGVLAAGENGGVLDVNWLMRASWAGSSANCGWGGGASGCVATAPPRSAKMAGGRVVTLVGGNVVAGVTGVGATTGWGAASWALAPMSLAARRVRARAGNVASRVQMSSTLRVFSFPSGGPCANMSSTSPSNMPSKRTRNVAALPTGLLRSATRDFLVFVRCAARAIESNTYRLATLLLGGKALWVR